ncbi:MAG: UDPGP type 1 family protein [Planctomycetaceae bacterium]|nr:UDPGP type 1 family protein [Planctomycetaceae bacterium]
MTTDVTASSVTGAVVAMTLSESLLAKLIHYGHSRILQHWPTLDADTQRQLAAQLEETDFAMLQEIYQSASATVASATDTSERIDRAAIPASVIPQPTTDQERSDWLQAAAIGADLLSQGKVAVITVAGGQGSRLGFEHPKGMFPIGPVSDRSLFQIFAEQIQARRRRHQAEILWMIMTSDATHQETVDFFRQQNWFGLNPSTVVFFQQGCLPALDGATGELLLNEDSLLCLSPDGHGGLVAALKNAGLLDRLRNHGVEHVFYHQVDNPTAILCDPALIGFHAMQQSQLTTNVVRKVSPTERMGVLADVGGRTEIIEYSELTPEQAARKDCDGRWIFWAGNTAIHVFTREFLEDLAAGNGRLPLHVARKNVPCLDRAGTFVKPDDPARPNAIKLERFIFDALPLAARTLIVEGDRSREFNPVKNRDGADSPETARQALNRIGRDWLRLAGIEMPDDQTVEISPLIALDADELKQQIASGAVLPTSLFQR